MPEIGTSGSMSGDRKRSDCHMAQATAPILDSTVCDVLPCPLYRRYSGLSGLISDIARLMLGSAYFGSTIW